MPENSNTHQPFDLSEEASKRRQGEEATTVARQAENDDVNEEKNTGLVNLPNDEQLDNEVWTSLSDEYPTTPKSFLLNFFHYSFIY
jgi:hypothetical protein